ncbi:MAG: SPOR domain-containing protein [Methyloceanibacter sp.]
MVRRRRTGSGNWSRGVFAAFWILLGCLSGLYLFNVLTNPTLGGQLVKLTPAEQGETSAAADGKAQDLAAIEENLRKLSQQVAALSGKIEGSETSAAPAAPESAETSAPPPAPAETATTGAEPPSPQAQEPQPAQAEAPKPPEPPKQPEAKPVEQAAVEPKPSLAPTPEPAAPSEPPPVASAPLDDLPAELQARANTQPQAPAPDDDASAEAPAAAQSPFEAPPAAPGSPAADASGAAPPEEAASPQEPAAASTPPETETAALDPITLPPAANDGSTRYGIEIGVVAKQDGLRPLWREYLTNHAALVAGLQPRRVLAPDKKWRLIAGPFTSAEEATQACALFKKASRPCEATVYAGDSL